MSTKEHKIDKEKVAIELSDIHSSYRILVIGLSIIFIAFIIALINNSMENPNILVQKMGQPLTFVGLGTLLFGVGKHLHILHLNIRIMMDAKKEEMNKKK